MKCKLLVIIPIMTFAYLLFVDTIPFGNVTDYHIDIGNNDTQGIAKLDGPFDRISEPMKIDNITIRELNYSPVYFSLKSSYLMKNKEKITVNITFTGDFPKEYKVKQ
jgi:hypothetical protein